MSQVTYHRPRVRNAGLGVTGFWTSLVVSSKIMALAAVFFLSFKASILESFYVPSASMLPTLQNDDFIFVPKIAYGLRLPFLQRTMVSWATPHRGEVVVFNRPDDPETRIDESSRSMVKRVIGIEGDSIHLVDRMVFVNGVRISEPYARWHKGGISSKQAFVVPSQSLFLLGDNRDESYDSRFWKDPFVSVDRVVGPVSAVYWSSRLPTRAGHWIR